MNLSLFSFLFFYLFNHGLPGPDEVCGITYLLFRMKNKLPSHLGPATTLVQLWKTYIGQAVGNRWTALCSAEFPAMKHSLQLKSLVPSQLSSFCDSHIILPIVSSPACILRCRISKGQWCQPISNQRWSRKQYSLQFPCSQGGHLLIPSCAFCYKSYLYLSDRVLESGFPFCSFRVCKGLTRSEHVVCLVNITLSRAPWAFWELDHYWLCHLRK